MINIAENVLLTLTFLNTRFLLISFNSSRFSKSRALSLHFFVIYTISI